MELTYSEVENYIKKYPYTVIKLAKEELKKQRVNFDEKETNH